jgi:hypothetical protein
MRTKADIYYDIRITSGLEMLDIIAELLLDIRELLIEEKDRKGHIQYYETK